MKYLLIDIGNTRIKCSLSLNGKINRPKSFMYDKHKFRIHFLKLIKEYSGLYEEVYVSALDKKYRQIIESVSKNSRINFITSRTKLPIKIEYANTLGSDRICSAVGAYKKFPGYHNILIIDMGTATTFGVVSNGVFKGGMISAGLMTSSTGLMLKTTLPKVVLNKNIKIINKTTQDAIISGLLNQQKFFVEKAIEEYKKMFKKLFVVLTGGASEFIEKNLEGVNKIDLSLVLEGLNHIAIQNKIK